MAKLKLSRKQILRIEHDFSMARNSIKSTLTQSQEVLNLKQSQIATNNMFDEKIKVIESLLSNLRNVSHNITTAPVNKEQIYRLGLIDYDIITRISECNVKLQSQSQELLDLLKSEKDLSLINEKLIELGDSFTERQKLYSSTNIF